MSTPMVHPFTKSSADVILHSSDNVNFCVHKLILSEASPFFETMFSLVQPTTSQLGTTDALPVVDLTETSQTTNLLLHFCYPMPHPEFGKDDLGKLADVLEAAMKYDISAAIASLRKLLVHPDFIEGHPFLLYSIACRLGLRPEAERAAWQTLRIEWPEEYTPELQAICPSAFYRLTEFRRRCTVASVEFIRYPPPWTGGDDGWYHPNSEGRVYFGFVDDCENLAVYRHEDHHEGMPLLPAEYQDELVEELIKRPSGIAIVSNRCHMKTLIQWGTFHSCSSCMAEAIEACDAISKDVGRFLDVHLAKMVLLTMDN
ncbi:hypothetical protein OBBRIDRAFT_775094 [Obba rivulosa]|uniref:BTB domain-containing protein n=1 Tax=Obba rivulosa TaxID=1052685 RepID=A0A8E2DKI6_9APHY|nr:hypothetical protein OBBRIDRAFT_775094 [Obba rivulosa]